MGWLDKWRWKKNEEERHRSSPLLRRRHRGVVGEETRDELLPDSMDGQDLTGNDREHNVDENEEEEEEEEERDALENEERTFFTVTENADTHLLSVEGEGVVSIVERRGDVLLGNLTNCIWSAFRSLPCCIVWETTFRKAKETSGKSKRTEERVNEFTDSTAVLQSIWPKGFGPGWLIRSFCPMILLFWCIILYDGVMNGPDLFSHLNGRIDAPSGSQSATAEDEYKHFFLQTAREDYPAQSAFLIEKRDGGSVLTKEIEIFSHLLKEAITCSEKYHCSSNVNVLYSAYRYEGYFMVEEERRAFIKPFFVNQDESATLIVLQHNVRQGPSKEFFAFLEDFLASNGPNPDLYRVSFTNEQKLLFIAQDEVIYDFEHADLIGIPFAWVILLWYCGFPAFLVLISLPVSILESFSLSVKWMPDDLELPTFAPSMIVSMAVALNVDYALFMLVRYSEELKRGANRNFALDKALSTAGKTIAVSGAIMLCSNGCLYFVKANTVASLGVALALTNLITIATNITLLPALLCMFGSTFDRLRQIPMPSFYASVKKLVEIAISPFRWVFNKVFGSGRKRKAFKIIHADNPSRPRSRIGSVAGDDSHEEDLPFIIQESDSVYGENTPASTPLLQANGAFASAAQTTNQGLFFEDDGHEQDNLFAHDLAERLLEEQQAQQQENLEEDALEEHRGPTTFTSEMSTTTSLADMQQLDITAISMDQGPLSERTADPESVRALQRKRARHARSESKKILSAQSRVWAAIANLCLRYPRTLSFLVLAGSIPLCVQVGRFEWTDSQANLVPANSTYVKTIERIADVGFPPGWIADYKGILAGRTSSGTPGTCFDDDVGIRQFAPYVKKYIPLVTIESCKDLRKFMLCENPKAGKYVRNFCPVSCNSCFPELYNSQEFVSNAAQVSELILKNTLEFTTMDVDASGGVQNVEASVLESVTFFMGRKYYWTDLRNLLSDEYGARNLSKLDQVDKMFLERFHNMTGIDGTRVLFRIHTPFHPYNELAHPWVNQLRHELKKAGFLDDPIDSSRPRFFLGGSVVRLFDQVDQVYADTPPVMVTAVVLTVLGSSVLVFQSLLLGPRLLLTVALTIGLVFGIMVLFFQDAKLSPDASGLYWIVPILGIPIMVGCTLDYDSFVVARIFEMRLAALSTEAAVFAGLQETGHVITIAGLIMTVAFGSMLASAIPVIQQIGALLVACCLLDTFIVRSLLVPSLMLIAVDWNWFPKKMPAEFITMDTLREAAAGADKRPKRLNTSATALSTEREQQPFAFGQHQQQLLPSETASDALERGSSLVEDVRGEEEDAVLHRSRLNGSWASFEQ